MDTRHDFLPATVSSVCCFRKFTLMNGLPGREATGTLEETLRAWTALASGQASRRAQGLTARDADGGSGGGGTSLSPSQQHKLGKPLLRARQEGAPRNS